MKNKILALGLVLALVAVMVMPLTALAVTSGYSSGTFSTANVAPTGLSVALWSTVGTPAAVTAMDPQSEYNVKVGVTDSNGLADLSTVKVTIFYSASIPTFPTGVPTSGATQTAAIITCTVGTTPSWAIDPSTSTTWSVVSANCVQPSLAGTTGTFQFHFIPGKAATAAIGKWYIYAIAQDQGSSTGDTHQDTLTMSWYGEVTGITGSVTFTGATMGSTDLQCAAPISVTYISNGNYAEQIKTDDGASNAQWIDGSKVVSLVSSAPGAGQMRLKGYYAVTLGSAISITSSYQDLVADGTITSDTGTPRANNTLWLSLGSTGIQSGNYGGRVYFQIVNR